MKKSILVTVFLGLVLGVQAEASTLEQYIQIALEENPGLSADREAVDGQRAAARAVRGLPDPMLRYSYFVQSVETALGPQERMVMLDQKLPWFGKRRLRGDVVDAGADAMDARLRGRRLSVIRRVASAYFELAYLERNIELTLEKLDFVRFQESVARSRYRTGGATHPDVVKAQVKLGMLEDRVASLEDRRRPLQAKLNTALGRSTEAHLPHDVSLDEVVLSIPSFEQVRSAISDQNPELEELRQRVRQQEIQTESARRERLPDLTLGVQGTLVGESELTSFDDSGRDIFLVSASINVPLWRGKYDGAVDAAAANHRAAEWQLRDRQQRFEAEAEDTLFELRDATRKLDLYENRLVPKGKESLQATSAAFRTGDANFLDVIDAIDSLLEFELQLARARADLGIHRVNVAALMGQEMVDATADKETP